MKILAMYLPQFHRVIENDKWWGEGFTEWTAVKNARKLFPDHNQPREPLNENYYDLMQKQTMVQQAEYMHKYGIDGMCFYHYYFKDGKKILEKPAENLLNWKEIDMPFCFCWANESWIRTWSNVNDGNPWMSINEQCSTSETDNGVLLEQKYGERDDWEKHFYYLLPFLKDSRYIKKDGHPIFVIYKAGRIYCLKEMLDCWNTLAEREGLRSFYLIASNIQNEQENYVDRILIHEPQDTLHRYFIGHREKRGQVNRYSYDEVWKKILSKPIFIDNICRGSFVDYDDTPRMGENGTAIIGATPQKFQGYFSELLADAKGRDSEYVFVNAWNEWGEGMYLEPDKKNKFGYLQAIRQAKETLAQKDDHTINTQYTEQQELKNEIVCLEETILRYKGYWKVLNSWLNLKEENKSVASFLKKQGFSQIAIYGLGMLGKHLIRELAHTDIKILYGIDQKGQTKNYVFPVYTDNEEWEKVDLIIVTVGYAYEKIRMVIKQKLNCEIMSLEEVIEEANQ